MKDAATLEGRKPSLRAWRRVQGRLANIRSMEVSGVGWHFSSLSVTPPTRGSTWVFATKLDLFRRSVDTDRAGLGYLGRYGTLEGTEALVRVAIRRGATVWFVGDLDPLDLGVYLQLVAVLPGREVRFAMGEDALRAIGPPRITQLITMDRHERRGWGILRPELVRVLGPTATALLDGGFKLEIDAIWCSARRGELDAAALFRTMGLRAKLRPE